MKSLVPPEKIDLEVEMDRLYAHPLAGFVEARNVLAARLKGATRTQDARRVKALKKASVAAWAVNQLRFATPEILAALLAAGDLLRDRKADRAKAMEARREALAAARRKAEWVLVAAGHAATPDLQRRIGGTLEAVVAYGNAEGRPEVGRLTEELPAPGFDEIAALGLLGDGVPRLKLVPPMKKAEPPPAARASRDKDKGKGDAEEKVKAEDDAKARRESEKKRFADEKREEGRFVLEKKSREKEAGRARAALQESEKRLEAARARQRGLETALSEAMRKERRFREEVAAAKKALEDALKAAGLAEP